VNSTPSAWCARARRFPCRLSLAMMTALALAPAAACAQAGSGCGKWSAGFADMMQGLGAFGDFFYGPFFKIGCLTALVVAGVVLLMDDGQMGRIAQFVLRAICIVAFIGGAGAFFTTPSANCAPATG
jgi:hypothetical protein